MKDKKYKYLEDLIEEYIRVTDEQADLPLQLGKTKEKLDTFLKEHAADILKGDDAQHVFKIHTQLKKYEENRKELEDELSEVEGLVKEFLATLQGCKIAYEKKDDNKSKTTFLFSLEGEELKCSRI